MCSKMKGGWEGGREGEKNKRERETDTERERETERHQLGCLDLKPGSATY